MRETRVHEYRIDEPVTRRHRRAVVEERRVADHDRRARRVADHDLERAARLPAEQDRERREVGVSPAHDAASLRSGNRYGVVVVVVADLAVESTL